MIRASLHIAVFGLLTILGRSVAFAADAVQQDRMYSVACKFTEVDRNSIVTALARPQVTMLAGQEAVVQIGGPSIALPLDLMDRLAEDLPMVHPITMADDHQAMPSIYHAEKSASKWQITVTPSTAGQVLLDAKLNLTDVESPAQEGVVIATQGLRVIRRVALDKAVSLDLPRPDGQKRRIEFTVHEVKRGSVR